ncbi:MAG: flagellar hook-basal body complex protein FliE [Phycisphaerales bacterium]
MADPLRLIGNPAATSGLLRAHQPPLPGNAGVPADGGPAFKDVLSKSLDEVNQLQAEASVAAEDLATGKRSDIEGVMLATQKADSAFRMLLALKNKVQAAYEEIKQVRV